MLLLDSGANTDAVDSEGWCVCCYFIFYDICTCFLYSSLYLYVFVEKNVQLLYKSF